MFLQRVYKHHKGLFTAMIAFIIAQLFINFKRGLVFSPFYHYGMYSEVMKFEKTYGVFEIEVNERKLRAQDFSMQQWDNIILPLTYYSSINKSNSLYNSDIKRLMNKVYIGPDQKNFLQDCDVKRFENWYKLYLRSLLKQNITSLNIFYRYYRYSAGHLQPTDSTLSLSQLCS